MDVPKLTFPCPFFSIFLPIVPNIPPPLSAASLALLPWSGSSTIFSFETGSALEQEVNNLEAEIALEENKLKGYTAKLKPGTKDTTGKPTTANAPPPEVIQDTIKALNANPSKALLDHVKAKFKEAYPDLEFEKYIKVNPAKYK